jgi:neutral ceramidase
MNINLALKICKISLKIVFFLVLILGLIMAISVKKIDRKDLKGSQHFKKWKSELKNLQIKSSKGLKASWAKVSLVPPKPTAMAGYGKRQGNLFTAVHDSVFVRSICLATEKDTLFLVSLDMLIMPPGIYETLDKELKSENIVIANIHFGATHTHNSVGSWSNSLAGRFFAGPYDEEVETFLVQKIKQSILKSRNNLLPSSVYYSEGIDSVHVRNRLAIKDPKKDVELRALKIKRENGSEAVWLSYPAHSTVLNASTMQLSRDYSGVVIDSLANKGLFGMFMAGAVGSMGPIEKGKNDWEEVKNQGKGIWATYQNLIWQELEPQIFIKKIKIPMPEPSPKISQDWALRPFAFKKLYGDYPVFMQYLGIGNFRLVGTPCDFSGELMIDLDAFAKSKKMNLAISSFNGGYIGYLTHDRLFDLNLYETRTMSWYGPYMGQYYSGIIQDLVALK